jgi:hypothetical protein
MGIFFSSAPAQPPPCYDARRPTCDEIGPRVIDEYCPLCSQRLREPKRSPAGKLEVYVTLSCRHIYHSSCMQDYLLTKYHATIDLRVPHDTYFEIPLGTALPRCVVCRDSLRRMCKVKFEHTAVKRWWPLGHTWAYDAHTWAYDADVEPPSPGEEPIASRTRSKASKRL